MSKFQELSQAIGVQIHKSVKRQKELGITSVESIMNNLRHYEEFNNAVKELVNHTIKKHRRQ